ncbi:hypothetical protein SR187_3050 [Streptococcus ruminantium]|uniref:Uncharacterized protein n=1 Tax=Streptococcus ruminantium TaxID=1917441 RepID=A0A2Z5TLF9_9STRE|nr:hypothetical protein SR187_3050 [Streptococcus ruminantium]
MRASSIFFIDLTYFFSKKKDKYKVVIWKREKFLYFSLPKS